MSGVLGSLEAGAGTPEINMPAISMQTVSNGFLIHVHTGSQYADELFTASTLEETLNVIRTLHQRWEAFVNQKRDQESQPRVLNERGITGGVPIHPVGFGGGNGWGQQSERSSTLPGTPYPGSNGHSYGSDQEQGAGISAQSASARR